MTWPHDFTSFACRADEASKHGRKRRPTENDVGEISVGSDLRPKLTSFGRMSGHSSSLASRAFAVCIFGSSLASAGQYRLPWAPGTPMELTQDCNDSFFSDHVGSGKNAWDFANGGHFAVSAAREGIVTHLKMSSHA